MNGNILECYFWSISEKRIWHEWSWWWGDKDKCGVKWSEHFFHTSLCTSYEAWNCFGNRCFLPLAGFPSCPADLENLQNGCGFFTPSSPKISWTDSWCGNFCQMCQFARLEYGTFSHPSFVLSSLWADLKKIQTIQWPNFWRLKKWILKTCSNLKKDHLYGADFRLEGMIGVCLLSLKFIFS